MAGTTNEYGARKRALKAFNLVDAAHDIVNDTIRRAGGVLTPIDRKVVLGRLVEALAGERAEVEEADAWDALVKVANSKGAHHRAADTSKPLVLEALRAELGRLETAETDVFARLGLVS